MDFLFLLMSLISLLNLSLQSKLSMLQELTGYSSLTIKQNKLEDGLTMLALAGTKAFKYTSADVFGTQPTLALPEFILIDSSFMSDSKSSVMLKGEKQDILMGCTSSNHLELLNENGKSIAVVRGFNDVDPQFRCSLNAIDKNIYLLSYVGTSSKYFLETYVANSTVSIILPIKSNVSEGYSAPFLCKPFRRESADLILCIYYNNNRPALFGMLYDGWLYPKLLMPYEINNQQSIHYTIYPIDELSVLVFSMTEKTATVGVAPLYYMLMYDPSLEQLQLQFQTNVLDHTGLIEFTCPLIVTAIATDMFVVCSCDTQMIYFQRFYNDLRLHGRVIKFDTQLVGMQSMSVAVFSVDIIAMIATSAASKHYLLAVEYPTCQGDSFKLKRYDTLPLASLVAPGSTGANQRIFFLSNSASITETSPPIELFSFVDVTTALSYIEGGVFYYSFELVEDLNGYDAYSTECLLTVDVCNNKCATCTAYGDDGNLQCITCSPGYVLDPAFPGECVSFTVPDGSYLDPIDGTVKPCYQSCAKCSGAGTVDDTNCDLCDTAAYYPHPTAPKQCVNTEIDNYYIDLIRKRYAPCYSTCLTCTGGGSATINMCKSCQTGFTLKAPSSNCINSCIVEGKNIYYDANLNFFCTPSSECLADKPYLIPSTKTCVDTCPSNQKCEKLCPLCPSDAYANIQICTCLSDGDILLIVDNALKGILSKESREMRINWKNSTVEIRNSSSPANTESNTSWFEPGEIENVKQKLALTESEELIIFKQDIVKDKAIVNDVEYNFFYENTSMVRVSDYEDNGLLMSFPIKDTSSEEYQRGKKLFELGIDATNPLDPFFTHICYEFQTGNDTDIPRRDKYEYYLLDKSKFCPSKCTFESIDYHRGVSNCRCNKTENTNIFKQSFEEFKSSLINSLFDANWEVVICDMLVFNRKIIPTNIGNWFVLAMLLLSVANLIVFLQKKFKPLEFYLKSLQVESATQTREKSPVTKIRIGASINNDITDIQAGNGVNSSVQGIGVNSSMQGIGVNSSLQVINDPNCPVVYSNVKPEVSSIDKKYSFMDYKKMPFEEIILKDTRSVGQHYWDNLKIVQPIIYTFFFQTQMSISTIKIAVFIIGVTIDFSLSAFFYADKYISKIYRGEDNFFYSLPISIYTYLVRSVLGLCFYFLTSSISQIEKIQKKNNGKNRELMIQKFLKTYQIRIIVFFSLKAALMLFLWYYTSAFCGTYKNSQTEWIISGVTSFAISQMFPFVVALVYTAMIEIAIKQKVKCLYRLYNII